jgi:hypothetical protein
VSPLAERPAAPLTAAGHRATAYLPSGLLDASDWVASWVQPVEHEVHEPGFRPAYTLRGEARVDKPVASARLYATANGIYEASLNGRRVGDVELTPGYTEYDERTQVQTYDVTELVAEGVNVLGALLADGWYRGEVGMLRSYDQFGDRTALLLQLHVDHPDGTTTVVGTGAGWTSTTSHILAADLIEGQTEDRRLLRDWSDVDGDAVVVADLGHDHLVASAAPPVRVVQELRPVAVRTLGRPGDGFDPRFTTHGFRYVRVEGHPGKLTAADLTGVVVHTDLRVTGSFECSDPKVNALHDAAVWSFRGNACDIPTDCPTRERAGWTGDWQLYVPTAAFLYDVAGFSTKWLRDLAVGQWENGIVGNMVPMPPAERTGFLERVNGSAGWGDASLLVPWEIHQEYGDLRLLGEQWPSIVAWLTFQLVPDELRGDVADRLAKLVRDNGTHLATGFLATPDLLPALAEGGHLDVAYDLLFQDTAPSWMTMIDRGATTVWERWEGVDDHGVPHESLNHYSKGAVIGFLHRYVVGIERLEPTYRRFRVQPRPGGGITWAQAQHESPHGLVAAAWRIVDAVFVLSVTVPPGCSAEVVLPSGASHVAGPGAHHWR